MATSTATRIGTFTVKALGVEHGVLGTVEHEVTATGTRTERAAALAADLKLAQKILALLPEGARLTRVQVEKHNPVLWVNWTITTPAPASKPAPAKKVSAPKTTRGLSTPDKRLVTQTSNRLHITPQAARTLLGI